MLFMLTDDYQPLSDVFSATPNGASQQAKANVLSPKNHDYTKAAPTNTKGPSQPSQFTQDSGYYGSQDINSNAMPVEWEQGSSQKPAWPSNPAMFSTKLSPSRPGNMDSRKSGQPKTIIFSDGESSPMRQPQSSSPLKYSMNIREPLSEVPAAPDTVESKFDDIRSPSEGSSPIRPVVRKSSLNFASLPAREPLGAGKTTGRVSRTSHLEPGRASYYQRAAGGKSSSNYGKDVDMDGADQSDVDLDDKENSPELFKSEADTTSHTKTYTQRLQDQINQLGKSKAAPISQSKSVPHTQSVHQEVVPASQSVPASMVSPPRKQSIHQALQTTPGAFPEDDDEDDWIEPPGAAPDTESRPNLPKSYSTDVMEGIHSKQTISQPEFVAHQPQTVGRIKAQGHGKSASASTLPIMRPNSAAPPPLTKSISTSGLSTVSEANRPQTPSDSPSRLFRDSPLKQVKNKLSSILKSSRGLLASSAAISAEGKSSLLSPSTSRLGVHPGQSSDSVSSKPGVTSQNSDASHGSEHAPSPSKSAARRTRASVERQKEEQRREKEAKLMTEQMSKLEKAREKEREKARVFSKEQETISAMEREIASKKQDEKALPLETPKTTRTSPRKVQESSETASSKAQAEDVEMADAPSTAPPHSTTRATGTLHALRNREVKRPTRPTKDAQAKTQQARTVIRVKAGSQHSQHQNSQSTSGQDYVAPSNNSQQLNSKASKASLQNNAPSQNLKSSTNARANALEAAAKKKEQEERDAQKRREAKAEVERKRLASQEEQKRQEQQKRAEIERQRKEKEAADERKNAQRQAAIEKAKQTKAPPPAPRSQPTGPADFSLSQQKASQKTDGPVGRPPSRVMTGTQRQNEEASRLAATKPGIKRTAPHEATDESQDRRPQSRAGPAYQSKDGKRRRTSEVAHDEAQSGAQQHIKGPPLRPSAQFKKVGNTNSLLPCAVDKLTYTQDMPSKPLFASGYSKAPPSAARDLFKATVAPQHSQAKAAHPLDMAQISKAAIPFAPSANPAGTAFKTPGRPGPYTAAKSAAKSVAKPSPQYPNGENIELPEIQTDDEDDEEEAAQGMAIADWANSPFLSRDLEAQQLVDPLQIFGAPGPINMEEVFNKSKDRFHKFRDRTSSANWSGADRLTEDDIRKDLAAREKLRREGGWSYQMGKDMI